MRPIFISYRRDDSEGQAGRLFQALREAFGADAVFMDVATIEPGVDFRRAIEKHTASCGALLALIGRRWLNATDAQGRRRLDDPNDFVRLETAAALQRDIPVIPVLVQDAPMVRAEELPEDLKNLAFRNSVELTHARWDSDVEVLIKALRPLVEGAALSVPTSSSAVEPRRGQRGWRWGALAALLAAAGAAGGGYWVVERERERTAAAKVEAERLAAEKAALEKSAAEKAAQEKSAADKAALDKAAADKAAADKAAAQKAEAERLAAQRAEAERRRLATEKAEAERQRREAEQAELDRRRREAEAADAERQRREAAQKIEAEKRAAQIRAAQNGECLSGWVWREAWAGDKVCVTPAIRSRTASENANAANTREARGGAYGAATCRQGYVWREARAGDTVCVVPASRDQARADNAAAASRRVQMPR